MSDHDNRQETTRQLGPRKRRQALLALGLCECSRCRRTVSVEQMSKKGKGRVGSACRECEAARLRELRARPQKTAPNGAPALTAPVIRGTYNPAMEKALKFAREALADCRSTRRRS
jgi:hypothetical protein